MTFFYPSPFPGTLGMCPLMQYRSITRICQRNSVALETGMRGRRKTVARCPLSTYETTPSPGRHKKNRGHIHTQRIPPDSLPAGAGKKRSINSLFPSSSRVGNCWPPSPRGFSPFKVCVKRDIVCGENNAVNFIPLAR